MNKAGGVAIFVGISPVLQRQEPTSKYTSLVYVDALSKTKRHKYAAALRRRGVPNESVQGVLKEENNALIRLADALAGWVRDVTDGQVDMRALYNEATRLGIVIEV